MRRHGLLWVLGATAGIRIALLLTRTLELDGDEAVTGLMARRILDGEHRAFFAGQDYMGTLEQYAQAAVLAVLPDTAFTLRLPQVASAVIAAALVHELATRCGLSARRALLASAMFAVGPYFPVYWSAKSRGAYSLALVLGLAGLVLVLGVRRDDRRWPAAVAAFGLVAGLGFWSNQQAAYLLVPAGLWLLGTMRGRWAVTALAAVPPFVVGASPALWRWATTDADLLGSTEGSSSIAERAQHFVTGTLPDLLGVRDDAEPIVGWLPPAFVSLVAIAALGVAVDRHRSGLASIVRMRPTGRDPLALVVLVLALAPFLYVASGTATTATARFVFVLYGALPVAAAAMPVPGWLRRWLRPTELAALVAHTAMGCVRLIAQDDGGHDVASGEEVLVEDMGPVADALAAAGARTAYADYWLAHPLNWVADESVLVESLTTRRFPHISRAVEDDPSPAFVVSGDEIGDVRSVLDARGATYRDQQVGRWWIVTDVSPGIHVPGAGTVAEAIEAAG